jgi:hypothetical protein
LTAAGGGTNGKTLLRVENQLQHVSSSCSSLDKKPAPTAKKNVLGPHSNTSTCATAVYKPTATPVLSSTLYLENSNVLNSLQQPSLSNHMAMQTLPDNQGSLSSTPLLTHTNESPLPSIPRNVGHGCGKSVDDPSQVTKNISGL